MIPMDLPVDAAPTAPSAEAAEAAADPVAVTETAMRAEEAITETSEVPEVVEDAVSDTNKTITKATNIDIFDDTNNDTNVPYLRGIMEDYITSLKQKNLKPKMNSTLNSNENVPLETKENPTFTVPEPEENPTLTVNACVDNQTVNMNDNCAAKTDDKLETEQKCPSCDKIFNTPAAFNEHKTSHCSPCKDYFQTENNLNNHQQNHMLADPATPCAVCGQNCNNPKHNQALYCPSCGTMFEQAAELEQHNINSYQCGPNSKYFSNKRNLVNHKNTNPISTSQQCDNSFSNQRNLAIHQNNEHNSTSHQCDQCDKSFSNKRSLGSHQKIHRENRLVSKRPSTAASQKCPHCSRAIAAISEDSMRDHLDKCDKLSLIIARNREIQINAFLDEYRVSNDELKGQLKDFEATHKKLAEAEVEIAEKDRKNELFENTEKDYITQIDTLKERLLREQEEFKQTLHKKNETIAAKDKELNEVKSERDAAVALANQKKETAPSQNDSNAPNVPNAPNAPIPAGAQPTATITLVSYQLPLRVQKEFLVEALATKLENITNAQVIECRKKGNLKRALFKLPTDDANILLNLPNATLNYSTVPILFQPFTPQAAPNQTGPPPAKRPRVCLFD
jgi:hypothetical protein